MSAHVNYEPTEYEQLLIAAGWIDAGSLDPEYLEYCRKTDWVELAYPVWLSLRKQWNELDQQYKSEIEPYTYSSLPSELWARQEELLDQMSEIEIALGY